MFHLRDCPRQGQSQTIINRLLKESEGATSKVTNSAAKRNKSTQSKKRKNSLSGSDDEVRSLVLKLYCSYIQLEIPSSRSTRKSRKSEAGKMIAQPVIRQVCLFKQCSTLTNRFRREANRWSL